jgi:hypothetical protein
MADNPTKASDVTKRKAAKTETVAEQPKDSNTQPKSDEARVKPGEPLDNPTASGATGEHPEPTKKNEPTSLGSGKEQKD